MKQYWLRLLAAWILIKVASSLVKDAERNLQTTAKVKDVEPEPTSNVIDAEVVTP